MISVVSGNPYVSTLTTTTSGRSGAGAAQLGAYVSTQAMERTASAGSTTDSTTVGAAAVARTDFTRMTRQALDGWINDQLSTGKITINESAALGAASMSATTPVAGGRLSGATDSASVDFIAKVQQGIESARQRNAPQEARLLETALTIMLRNQRSASSVDTLA